MTSADLEKKPGTRRGGEDLNLAADLKTTAGYLLMLVLVPLIVVLGLTFINRNSKERLASRYGAQAVVWLGGLGVIIHELSHLITALLFGHRINDFRLLITNVPDDGGALGYVNHSWDKGNYYQFIGNALIGTAPVYGCAAVLILLTRWLVPAIYWWGLQTLGSVLDYPLAATAPASAPLHWGAVIIWALLSINITIGGFDLSNADLKNALPAAVTLYILVGVILFVLILLGKAALIQHVLIVLLAAFGMVMAVAICWSLLVNLIVRL